MAHVRFAEADEARAAVLLMRNRVPFNSYRGGVYELIDSVLDGLTQSGIAFQRVDRSPATPDNGSRVTMQLIGGIGPGIASPNS